MITTLSARAVRWNISIERVLVYATFFFCFTPFFSFYPISADLQPLFLMLILVLLAIAPRMQRFSRYELIFFLLGLWSVVYIDLSDPYFTVRKSMGLLMAFLVYHFFRKYAEFLSQKLLLIIVLVNFSMVFFNYVAPDLFIEIFGRFVRVVKATSMEGPRGAAGFSPEAGFTGALAVFYLAVSIYLREYVGDKRYFFAIVFFSIAIMVMSKSGAAGMLLVMFLSLKYFRLRVPSLLAGAGFLIITYLAAKYFDLGRAGFAIKYLFEDPVFLLTVDASVGQRVINIAVGVLSVYEFPFGSGAGSFEKISAYIIEEYRLTDFIAGSSGNVSAFGKYSVELGLVFWMFLASLIFKAVDASGLSSIPYIIVALFFVSASFSIVFPPTWFIFAALHSRNPLGKAAQLGVR